MLSASSFSSAYCFHSRAHIVLHRRPLLGSSSPHMAAFSHSTPASSRRQSSLLARLRLRLCRHVDLIEWSGHVESPMVRLLGVGLVQVEFEEQVASVAAEVLEGVLLRVVGLDQLGLRRRHEGAAARRVLEELHGLQGAEVHLAHQLDDERLAVTAGARDAAGAQPPEERREERLVVDVALAIRLHIGAAEAGGGGRGGDAGHGATVECSGLESKRRLENAARSGKRGLTVGAKRTTAFFDAISLKMCFKYVWWLCFVAVVVL